MEKNILAIRGYSFLGVTRTVGSLCLRSRRLGLIMLVAWLGTGCATMAPDFSAEEFPESAPNTQPVKDSSPPPSLADRPVSSEERIRDKTLEPDTMKVPVWEPETASVE